MNEKLVDVEEEEFQQTSLKIRALEKFYSASDSLS